MIPQLLVFVDNPTNFEINTNIEIMLGSQPFPANTHIGQILMLDRMAIEELLELLQYKSKHNSILGLCQKHSHTKKKDIDAFSDLETLQNGLDLGSFHLAKEEAMFVFAPVTAAKNYYLTTIGLLGICKTKLGPIIAETTWHYIKSYNTHLHGRA